jgi:NAD(P)-dependent dehydrogenase (short-subunit alcohol dehydrogenase family)
MGSDATGDKAMSVSGRRVLVTGGGRGLGRAIAERLAQEGARVGVLARTAMEVELTADAIRELGGEAAAFPADVCDAAAVRRAFDRFRTWAGGLDDLVCAAGRLKAVGPLATVDPELWWHDVETAVRGVQLCVREAVPLLRVSGSPTITVLVGPGHNGALPFATGYAAAQSALVRLVESLARELAADRVAVHAVNPGLVVTALVRPLVETAEGRRWLPLFTEALAEGKEVGPEVVAEMVQWLIDRRPPELSGRVVASALAPVVVETRLERIRSDNLGVLRLR